MAPTQATSSVKINGTVKILDIADLLCSAWEGGSTYWARQIGEKKPKKWTILMKNSDGKDDPYHYSFLIPLNGGHVILQDIETEKNHVLDMKAILRGCKVMSEKYPAQWGAFRTENYDADTGDCFLQCCLFGDVIYG